MGGGRKPGPTGAGHPSLPPSPAGNKPVRKKHAPPHSHNQYTNPNPSGASTKPPAPAPANQVSRIVVIFDPSNSAGELYAIGSDGSVKLKGNVVVGGKDSPTPTGTYHASHWESNHVSTKYGSYANTPWDQSPLGLNAFGPYQLHLKELETRGIYIHGTMGPSWNPFTGLNSLVSPTSHGCVRMANRDNVQLHDLLPNPSGVEVKISTSQSDAPH